MKYRHHQSFLKSFSSVILAGTIFLLPACHSGEAESIEFAQHDFKRVINDSKGSNGLISMNEIDGKSNFDLMASSVLHEADGADPISVDVDKIKEVCEDYGEEVPVHQRSAEIATLLTPSEFRNIDKKLECVGIEPPRYKGDGYEDPQQFLLAVNYWVYLPGIDEKDVPVEQIKDAFSELPQEAQSNPWNHWICQNLSKKSGKSVVCKDSHSMKMVDQLSSTEDLMQLRAAVELNNEYGYPSPPEELVKESLNIPVVDALDAQQIQRISEIRKSRSSELDKWVSSEKKKINKDGFVESEIKAIGTLIDTYLATRLLEGYMDKILTDDSYASMSEIVELADKTSTLDGTTARLMKAVILDKSGKLNTEDKSNALSGYHELVDEGCPEEQIMNCIWAIDAAYQLDGDPGKVQIKVPEDLPTGKNASYIIYRVMGVDWGVDNIDDWRNVSLEYQLDPKRDIEDTHLDVGTRAWAGAARSNFYSKLDTEEENNIRNIYIDMGGCREVKNLLKSDLGKSGSCDLEATFAYYISGSWSL